MRFSQFKEGAMEDTIRIMQKTFSPERKAVQDEVLRIARAVEMGKDDKMMLARAITELTKSELEVKRSDPDLKVSTEQNLNILKKAMDKLTGVTESVGEIAELTETEVVKIIRSKRGLGSLRNRSAYDGLSKIKNIELDKKDAPKKAVGESLTEALKVGDKVKAKKGSMKSPSQQHYERTVGTIVKVYSDGDVKVNFGGNDNFSVPGKLLVKTQVEESLTEAEFDEAAGEKDACYHKVKSRYKVWPSAYASGALVKCRKVGAANWGNSKKK